MHTPVAAFAWELWRRHRPRLIIIAGFILAFALVYPKLCALAGLNLGNPDALEDIAKKFELMNGTWTHRVIQILYLGFLACGPEVVMVLSLLYVTWMFTFTENDHRIKDPMKFPGRLFTLPVSTPFLFWWLFLAGMAGILVLFWSWVLFVPLPHVDIFAVYQNCFGWMTLLALVQGIVWALAGWPVTRSLVLTAVFVGFGFSPARRDMFESPLILAPLFLAGLVLARAGLQKMRHGQWQGWTWEWPLAVMPARAEMRGPKRFASPAQAQLWFEWHRSARRLCFYVAVLAGVPVAIHLLVRAVAGYGPMQGGTLCVFAGGLIGVPLMIHFLHSVSPARSDMPFLMVRPQTDGEMMMATLKAVAIGTLISWLIILAVMCALPLLGDFKAVEKDLFPARQFWPIIALGLMLLTWRLIAINLCFVWSGKKRLQSLPALMLLVVYAEGAALAVLNSYDAYWNLFLRYVPCVLAGLIVVKFTLAFLAFRVSLKRKLLAPSALAGYLAVWVLLVAVLLSVLLISPPPGKELILPLSLGIVLFVPLARIGLCPIALSWNRHNCG
jgi:hypothetical protein